MTLPLDLEDEREELDDDDFREEAEEDLELEPVLFEVVIREDPLEEPFLVRARLFPVMD